MSAANEVGAALSLDPLAEAERLTGHSYKEDSETMRLGLALSLLSNTRKESLLRESADSYFAMTFTQQLDLFADLGFIEALHEPFSGHHGPEAFVILWHPDGILATCESYCGTRRNAAKVYYNFRHSSGEYPCGLTSSGGMHGDVWVGDHDAREGIRHNLNAMRAQGQFLPVWVERPFLWLLNYTEPRVDGYDYREINAARIARLPEHVQAGITPVQVTR